MFWDYTMLILIPGLLLGLWAQARVQSAYAKYSRVRTQRGLPAEEVVGQLLRQESADHVVISRTSGQLTDYFDPRTDTLRVWRRQRGGAGHCGP